MRPAAYLIRFDDLTPTMNWAVWDKIEEGLSTLPIRPILAVVPDNRDPVLQVGPANPAFWDRVRAWDARGWTVAYHGFQHAYVTDRSGIVGLNRRSEFAGLPREEQERKVSQSVRIMAGEGLAPRAWTAPSHSFDATTVAVLRDHGIGIINEGFYPYPHAADGMIWVPHQMWRFRPMPTGVWTFGYHINAWADPDVDDLIGTLRGNIDRVADLNAVARDYARRRMNPVEPLGARAYVQAIRARVATRRLLGGGDG